MKVTIDRIQCVSCGSCWDTCPALFVQNADDSFSQIVPEYQEKEIPRPVSRFPIPSTAHVMPPISARRQLLLLWGDRY